MDTQDVDDIRWNTVGVTFQVYPWSCSPLGKPRPYPLTSTKRKDISSYAEVEVEVVPAVASVVQVDPPAEPQEGTAETP